MQHRVFSAAGPCRHCTRGFFKMLGHVTVGDGDAIPACLVPAGATVARIEGRRVRHIVHVSRRFSVGT